MSERKTYKEMTKGSGYTCMDDILDYGRVVNIIIGQRTGGKTVSVGLKILTDVIRAYEKKQRLEFVYVRKDKDEADNTKADWFSQACDILYMNGWGKWAVTCKGNRLYLSGEKVKPFLCGYVVPLNLQRKRKSGYDFQFVKWIVYDEFISDNNRDEEYHDFINLFASINRMPGSPYKNRWGARAFFLGNNDTYNSSFYREWGIDKWLRADTHWLKPKNEQWILWQMNLEDTPKLDETYQESDLWALASKDERDYMFMNRAKEVRTETGFIEKVKKPMRCMFNFSVDGRAYGVYDVFNEPYIYVCSKLGQGVEMIALTLADHTPNTKYIRGTGVVYFERILQAYEEGRIKYDSWRSKTAVDNFSKWV